MAPLDSRVRSSGPCYVTTTDPSSVPKGQHHLVSACLKRFVGLGTGFGLPARTVPACLCIMLTHVCNAFVPTTYSAFNRGSCSILRYSAGDRPFIVIPVMHFAVCILTPLSQFAGCACQYPAHRILGVIIVCTRARLRTACPARVQIAIRLSSLSILFRIFSLAMVMTSSASA